MSTDNPNTQTTPPGSLTLSGKKARSSADACGVQERYEGKPHALMQWHTTDVCMDIHCVCGHSSHVDGSSAENFDLHVECPACHRVYYCNGHIELIEIEERPEDSVFIGDDG